MVSGYGVKILSPDQGVWLSWLGQPTRYLVTTEDSGGRFSLGWTRLLPGFAAPDRRNRFHAGYYVIKGTVEFTSAGQIRNIGGGGMLVAPPGSHFSFRNPGPGGAELLFVTAPSGFDRLQRQIGHPVEDAHGPFPPPTPGHLEQLRTWAPLYGIELGPLADPSQTAVEPLVRRPEEGTSMAVVGDVYRFLAVSEDTAGNYAFWHARVPPGGGPPPHTHAREEEAFFVLDGEVTFHLGTESVKAEPGTFAHLPRGAQHAFRNESNATASMIIMVAPAGLEKMFLEIGIPIAHDSEPPSVTKEALARLLASAPRYGIDIQL